MTPAVLDIETAGLLPGESSGDGSLRARAALEATNGEDADRYLALSWPLARVVSVAIKCGQREVVTLDSSLVDLPPDAAIDSASLRPQNDERELLAAVAQQLTVGRFEALVTFNGSRFDLPVLVARMVAHGIKPPALILACLREKPWEPMANLDLMNIFGHGKSFGVGSLRAWAIGLLGEDPKADGDGSHVGALLAARDGLGLARYNLGDVRITERLWLKWQAALGG